MSVNYSDLTPGTALVWTSSGGDYTLTGTSLTDGSARQGGKSATLIDGTKGFPELLEIVAETKVGSAPTDGKTLDVYLGFSPSATAGTSNPAGLGGSDAALSSPSSVTPQLTFLGSIVMSNAIGTGVQRQDAMIVRPKDAYVIVVLVNSTGQTLSSTGTDVKVTITPWYRRTPIA